MKLYYYFLLIVSFTVLNSCSTKEDKLRHLCQKWAFSDEDYNNRMSSVPIDVYDMRANLKAAIIKDYGKPVTEYDRLGKFTISFPESIYSSSERTEGKWEVDDAFKKLRFIYKSGRVQTFIINELTSNSLKLSYFENGEEFLEEYFPYIEKGSVEKESKSNQNDNLGYHESNDNSDTNKDFDVQTFAYEDDLAFGYLIRSDSTSRYCYFYSNVKDPNNEVAKMMINNKMVYFDLVRIIHNDDGPRYQEYESSNYKLRIDFEVKSSEDGYVTSYVAKLKIFNNHITKEIPNLYGEIFFD